MEVKCCPVCQVFPEFIYFSGLYHARCPYCKRDKGMKFKPPEFSGPILSSIEQWNSYSERNSYISTSQALEDFNIIKASLSFYEEEETLKMQIFRIEKYINQEDRKDE